MLLWTRELVESTPVGQEILAWGFEKGVLRGRLEAHLELVRDYLRVRFPSLADHAALTAIATAEHAHSLLLRLYAAGDEATARAALDQSLNTPA